MRVLALSVLATFGVSALEYDGANSTVIMWANNATEPLPVGCGAVDLYSQAPEICCDKPDVGYMNWYNSFNCPAVAIGLGLRAQNFQACVDIEYAEHCYPDWNIPEDKNLTSISKNSANAGDCGCNVNNTIRGSGCWRIGAFSDVGNVIDDAALAADTTWVFANLAPCVDLATKSSGLLSAPEADVAAECIPSTGDGSEYPPPSTDGTSYTPVPASCCDNAAVVGDAADTEDRAACGNIELMGMPLFNKQQCGEEDDPKLYYGEECTSSATGDCECEMTGTFTSGVCYATASFGSTKYFFRSHLCDTATAKRPKEADLGKVVSPAGGATGKLWQQSLDTVAEKCNKAFYAMVDDDCCATTDQTESLAYENPPECDEIELSFDGIIMQFFNERKCLDDGKVKYGEDCTSAASGVCSCHAGGDFEVGKCYRTAGPPTIAFFARMDSCAGSSDSTGPADTQSGVARTSAYFGISTVLAAALLMRV